MISYEPDKNGPKKKERKLQGVGPFSAFSWCIGLISYTASDVSPQFVVIKLSVIQKNM